jgi:hypothetical protein
MFETLFELPDDWLDWLFFITIWILVIGLLGLLIWGIISGINYLFLPEIQGSALIIDQYFTEAHFITTYMMVGKVLVPELIYIPDTWTLIVKIGDKTSNVNVSQDYYNSHLINSIVQVKYSMGRFYGFWVKEIY